MTRVGNDWKLARVVADLNLSKVRISGLEVKLNGAAVTSSTVSVFPGRYQLTTGSKQFTITSSDAVGTQPQRPGVHVEGRGGPHLGRQVGGQARGDP